MRFLPVQKNQHFVYLYPRNEVIVSMLSDS
jgi:hypothetical protein